MSDAQAADQGRLADRAVEFRLAAHLENLALARTIIGAIGAAAELDIDTVADLRLATDEMCTHLIRTAAPGADLIVTVDSRDDEFVVQAIAAGDGRDVALAGTFSWHVLTSLVDDVRTFRDGADGHFGIRLTLRRVGATR